MLCDGAVMSIVDVTFSKVRPAALGDMASVHSVTYIQIERSYWHRSEHSYSQITFVLESFHWLKIDEHHIIQINLSYLQLNFSSPVNQPVQSHLSHLFKLLQTENTPTPFVMTFVRLRWLIQSQSLGTTR